MKAYEKLVNKVLTGGYVVSVSDGEGLLLHRSINKIKIIEAIEAIDEALLTIRNTNGRVLGRASIIAGLLDGETVADWTDDDFMNALVYSCLPTN